jgi:hypothetical protein
VTQEVVRPAKLRKRSTSADLRRIPVDLIPPAMFQIGAVIEFAVISVTILPILLIPAIILPTLVAPMIS